MEEVFWDNLEKYSPSRARRRYHWEVLKLLKPNLIKGFNSQKLNYIGMLQHNLLITLRGFKRHKTTFLINLIGLSTGLAAALLIFLWVNDERSVDSFHEKNDRLYWAMTHFQLPNEIATWDYTSGKLGRTMVEEYPEVEMAVWIGNEYFIPRGVLSFEESNYEIQGLFASENFFEVLSYGLISGQPPEVLKDKQSIVVSEKLALKVFGSTEKAIGQSIEFEDRLVSEKFTVSGVFKDPPSNATHQFEMVIPYDVLIEIDKWADEWNGGYAQNFLVLKEGVNIDDFNSKIADYMDTKITNDRFTVFVQKYADHYLYGQYENGELSGGRIESVRLFSIVAVLILVIACINFMNLSTAQASKKMKEIGVKKAIGAHRYALVVQFLSESLLISMSALVVSGALAYVLLPQFNLITGKDIVLNLSDHLPMLLTVALGTGLVAGSYPAFYLSGFKPVAVLKGKISGLRGEEFVRKGLVIVQFTLSIIFIVGVIVINRQIEFTQNRNLGYDRDNLVTFNSTGLSESKFLVFLENLRNIPGIVSTGNMAGDFLWGDDSGSGYWWSEDENERKYLFKSPKMGYNAIETLGLEIVNGRSFSPEFNDHEDRIIINESAAKMMGLEDAAGTRIRYGQSRTKEIIGVVRDFQYGSLHQKIEPLIIRFRDWGTECLVKLQRGSEMVTLERIEKLYKEFHPKYDFQAAYLDDDYRALYKSEQTESTLSNYMAGIAIIISCLGLFGLAAFTAERRTKEIGIRKILGASQVVIVKLLTGSFAKTLLIAILLSLPVAYYLAQGWLQNFAYSIALEWWFFALAGISALIIAWLTVSFQTFKASKLNPTECLRHE